MFDFYGKINYGIEAVEMKTFESFIESEAFFPVLILLLVMLVCVFMWIVLSNKKEAQKRREKKKVNIDENAEIKIVSDGYDDVRIKKVKKEKYEDEPERTEIAIVEEVKGSDGFMNITRDEPKETIYNIDLPNFNEARFIKESEDEEIIDYKNIDYGDLTVPPVPDIFKDEFEAKSDEDTKEEKVEEQSIDKIEEIDEDYEKTRKLEAFSASPNGDYEINEDIKVEPPKEYVGEKTEVFDFPDFDQDDIFSSGDIETEIITAAEDYIKDIMGNK